MGTFTEADDTTLLERFTRMKPPLVKFRLGDLYGRQNKEVTGFIKMLTYSIPETAVWETDENRRIPKSINVMLSYQVIHDHTPQLAFSDNPNRVGGEAFYGANMNISNTNSPAGDSFGIGGPSVSYINKIMEQTDKASEQTGDTGKYNPFQPLGS